MSTADIVSTKIKISRINVVNHNDKTTLNAM